MSGQFDVDLPNQKIKIVKDSRTVFDTSVRPPELVPAGLIALSNYDIEFPDLWKGVFYRQGRDSSGPFDVYTCLTCAAVIDQEWGPNRSSPNTLADVLLGTVPAGTDYIDVFMNTSRVVSPGLMYGQSINSFIPTGQEFQLPGGSVVVEYFGPLRRSFEVFLSGTGVYLRRRQSMSRVKGAFVDSRTVNQGALDLGNKVYYFSGTNAPYAPLGGPGPTFYPEPAYTLGAVIDSKTSGSQNLRPARFGGTGSCSESVAGVSYRSVYRTNFRITPGRVSP